MPGNWASPTAPSTAGSRTEKSLATKRTIIVTDPVVEAIASTCPQKVAIYTRVSAAEHKDNLEGQAT